MLNGPAAEPVEAPPSKEMLLYLAEYRDDELDPLGLEDSALLEPKAASEQPVRREPRR